MDKVAPLTLVIGSVAVQSVIGLVPTDPKFAGRVEAATQFGATLPNQGSKVAKAFEIA